MFFQTICKNLDPLSLAEAQGAIDGFYKDIFFLKVSAVVQDIIPNSFSGTIL